MDYVEDYKKIRKTIDNMVNTGTYSTKDLAFLGGAAAAAMYIEHKAKGEARKMHKDMHRVVSYLYKFETTNNPFYLTMASEEMKYVKEHFNMLDDEATKTHAKPYIEMAEQELQKHMGKHGGMAAGYMMEKPAMKQMTGSAKPTKEEDIY